jgi:hypothetical protein
MCKDAERLAPMGARWPDCRPARIVVAAGRDDDVPHSKKQHGRRATAMTSNFGSRRPLERAP